MMKISKAIEIAKNTYSNGCRVYSLCPSTDNSMDHYINWNHIDNDLSNQYPFGEYLCDLWVQSLDKRGNFTGYYILLYRQETGEWASIREEDELFIARKIINS